MQLQTFDALTELEEFSEIDILISTRSEAAADSAMHRLTEANISHLLKIYGVRSTDDVQLVTHPVVQRYFGVLTSKFQPALQLHPLGCTASASVLQACCRTLLAQRARKRILLIKVVKRLLNLFQNHELLRALETWRDQVFGWQSVSYAPLNMSGSSNSVQDPSLLYILCKPQDNLQTPENQPVAAMPAFLDGSVVQGAEIAEGLQLPQDDATWWATASDLFQGRTSGSPNESLAVALPRFTAPAQEDGPVMRGAESVNILKATSQSPGTPQLAAAAMPPDAAREEPKKELKPGFFRSVRTSAPLKSIGSSLKQGAKEGSESMGTAKAGSGEAADDKDTASDLFQGRTTPDESQAVAIPRLTPPTQQDWPVMQGAEIVDGLEPPSQGDATWCATASDLFQGRTSGETAIRSSLDESRQPLAIQESSAGTASTLVKESKWALVRKMASK